MQPVTIAKAVQQTTDQEFRFGVLSPDGPHYVAADFGNIRPCHAFAHAAPSRTALRQICSHPPHARPITAHTGSPAESSARDPTAVNSARRR